MRHRILCATLLALASLSVGCVSSMETPSGRQTNWDALVLVGERVTDDIVDNHPAVSAQLFTSEPGTGGWGLEVGGSYGWGDGSGTNGTGPVTRDTNYYELDLGIHQTFRRETALRPYFGVGGAWLRNSSTQRSATDSDTFTDHGAGVYAHTGLLWSPSQDASGRGTGLVFGLDLRGMLGQDVDYLELAFVTGFGR